MQYLAHDTRLNRRLKDGTTERENLEFALERYGSAKARALLVEGPQCPDTLRYLVPHAYAIVGRSGVGMSGLAPATWTTLKDYQAETGWTFTPWEKEALLQLDAVLRNASEDVDTLESPEPTRAQPSSTPPSRRQKATP